PKLNQVPLVRENRLYQADWLMRFYGFSLREIVSEQYPDLDLETDPKLSYALRHPHHFPVDVNKADYEMILRIPGVGVKSAKKIVQSRRFGPLRTEHLKKIGVVMKRAKYFLIAADRQFRTLGWKPENIRRQLLQGNKKVQQRQQLNLFDQPAVASLDNGPVAGDTLLLPEASNNILTS
ncbi:MAG: helix-hairpin-helix domain-containing protein, partial [Bacteroidota bacterium]